VNCGNACPATYRSPDTDKTSATSRRGHAMRRRSGGRRSAREVDAQPFERALDVADLC
jgi:hypothetical protein